MDLDEKIDLERLIHRARLENREKFILYAYYGKEAPLHRIGSLLGVSSVRVAQIRNKALKKIRKVAA